MLSLSLSYFALRKVHQDLMTVLALGTDRALHHKKIALTKGIRGLVVASGTQLSLVMAVVASDVDW